ncbi:unnamed protein product, partial [marine sediment metagenome]
RKNPGRNGNPLWNTPNYFLDSKLILTKIPIHEGAHCPALYYHQCGSYSERCMGIDAVNVI